MLENVAVIGAGTMGNGIAHVFASAGFRVRLVDTNPGQLEKSLQTIARNLDRQIAKGSITEEQKKKTLQHIKTFTRISESVVEANIAVEAASENIDLKTAIFKELDASAPADCILASNTSSISITKMASTVDMTDRDVSACVLKALDGLTFPQLKGDLLTVTYSLLFSPRGPP